MSKVKSNVTTSFARPKKFPGHGELRRVVGSPSVIYSSFNKQSKFRPSSWAATERTLPPICSTPSPIDDPYPCRLPSQISGNRSSLGNLFTWIVATRHEFVTNSSTTIFDNSRNGNDLVVVVVIVDELNPVDTPPPRATLNYK